MGEILKEYGFPTAVALGIAIVVWKGIWPLLTSLIERVFKTLESLVSKAQEANERQTNEFLRALERRDSITESQIKVTKEQGEQTRELIREVAKIKKLPAKR